MVLRLYNTRTQKKETFAPRVPGRVKMYVCGPTTYDYSHLGHARSYIDFDTARMYLEFLGYHVTYVVNFTDIEEVIIRRAKEAGKEPLAYALWKKSKGDEPSWPSPWGNGRPGWHVECNAMAYKYLGAPLDIHGGGVDLKFPHHESEAMICEGAWGGEWARTWMHNGFVTLAREKMSKSLGNFVTIREVLRDFPGEVIRLCLLKAPYREDVEYDQACFARAQKEDDGMRAVIDAAKTASGAESGGKVDALVARTRDGFRAAMDDDLNTRDAIFRLQQLTEAIVEIPTMSASEGRAVVGAFRESGQILGLFPDLG